MISGAGGGIGGKIYKWKRYELNSKTVYTWDKYTLSSSTTYKWNVYDTVSSALQTYTSSYAKRPVGSLYATNVVGNKNMFVLWHSGGWPVTWEYASDSDMYAGPGGGKSFGIINRNGTWYYRTECNSPFTTEFGFTCNSRDMPDFGMLCYNCDTTQAPYFGDRLMTRLYSVSKNDDNYAIINANTQYDTVVRNVSIWTDGYWEISTQYSKGTNSQGQVTASYSSAYPANGAQNGYWYESAGSSTSYSRGSYIGTVESENSSAYPNGSYTGGYWYENRTSRLEYSMGAYKDTVYSTSRNQYPDNGHDSNYWYVFDGDS